MLVRATRWWTLGLCFAVLALSRTFGQEPSFELPPPRPLPRPADVAPPPIKGVRLPQLPGWLPRYDLDMHIDVERHTVTVRQQVTWFNNRVHPTDRLVFNAHSHYHVPKADIGLLAKTLEIMRVMPTEALDTGAPPLEVQRVTMGAVELEFGYQRENDTALEVILPRPVGPGESATVCIDYVIHLPQKMGRYGQWKGVTFLSNWLPVLAVYDDKGWQPTPFVPWHQPYYNEAGIYTARVTLPTNQKVACSGIITGQQELPDGQKCVSIRAEGTRDFAVLCSHRFEEYVQDVPASPGVKPVRVKCLAFPEHEHYARATLQTACEVIPVYSRWFGPYVHPELTFVESYFGWNGNECSSLIMIDSRVFAMPHLGAGFVEYLIAHETCHQWWYSMIGTNGYCETWMDEAFANYFAHRHLNLKYGEKNNPLLNLPRGLMWLPNIRRQDYRHQGLYGTLGRGEGCPAVQDMPKFGHVVTLFSMAYDKGGKVVGMIEERLGEAAFNDFMRLIYQKYCYKILRVADFQRELEDFTARSWEEFFRRWLYGDGVSDWAVDKVELCDCRRRGCKAGACCWMEPDFLGALHGRDKENRPCRVIVHLVQKAEYSEQTVLGFSFDEGTGFQVRIPILPDVQVLKLSEPQARVERLSDRRVTVEVLLPRRPVQIAVDPDQVLVDSNPANNYWKPPFRWRVTPLYTFLEETDLTNAYDRWNILAGPWLYSASYNDPWYTRSTMVGARVGVFRTQQFSGGVYAAYRTDFRDVVAGVDGVWDHWPWPKTQVGFNAEHRLHTFYDGQQNVDRASIYGRYVFQYGSSMYLPPMKYAEVFGNYQDNFLPYPRQQIPGAERYQSLQTAGIHYHVNYLTPYWDAEGGYQLDVTYQGGRIDLEESEATHQLSGQLTYVQYLPDLSEHVPQHPAIAGPLRLVGATRIVLRGYGATGVPDRAELFSLGGSQQFRGFDLRQRQGSSVWVGTVEFRIPLARRLSIDVCDHVFGVRNLYAAAFYDVGDASVSGRSFGPVAHAVGGGLRIDIAVLGFVERTSLRFDVAQTVNADTPMQFWFGLQHPF